MTGFVPVVIVMESPAAIWAEVASVHVTTKVAVLATVGVPEMSPVEAARESPAGSDPVTD